MKIDLFSIGNLTIHGYGLMIGIGVLCCVAMGLYRAKKYNLSQDAVLDIAIYCIICGYVGAKLLFVIVEFESFLKDPLSVLGSQGFVVYGGITVGVLTGVLYCRIKKLSFWEYFDLLAPSVAIAQGFGRIGCFLAGCCYGRETDSFLGVVFPEGCMAPAGVKLLPTQLFSSIGDFIIMFILLFFYKKRKYTGSIGVLYMTLYAIGRFFIEMLRSDNRGGIGSLSTSQIISIVILALAIFLYQIIRKKGKREAIQ